MDDFDWMQAVMELADNIHKDGGAYPIDTLRMFLEETPYVTQDGDTLPFDIDAVIKQIRIGGRLDTKGVMDIVVQAISDGSPEVEKQEGVPVLKSITPEELTIEFAPNMIMVITTEGGTKRVHCSEIGLYDSRKSDYNVQGQTLFAMACNKSISKKDKKRVSLLRQIFREKLGVIGAAFSTDWRPLFTLIDGITKANNRAREQMLYANSRGGEIIDPGDPDRGSNDDATQWIEENS